MRVLFCSAVCVCHSTDCVLPIREGLYPAIIEPKNRIPFRIAPRDIAAKHGRLGIVSQAGACMYMYHQWWDTNQLVVVVVEEKISPQAWGNYFTHHGRQEVTKTWLFRRILKIRLTQQYTVSFMYMYMYNQVIFTHSISDRGRQHA